MDRSNDPRYNFDANPTVDELIAQQGKGPIGDPRTLLGDLWPDDEPIEEFLAALHEWRGHNRSDRALCAKWAEVTVAAQLCGRRIDCADAWIAATALLCDAPLITHNRNDYLGVPGLSLISHGQ